MALPRLAVVGSVNLDLVARAERLPRPGETVTEATFRRVPGGKGANQALAAARLGADVTLIGCVGDDGFAQEALVELCQAGVALDGLKKTAGPTGVALILVDSAGENEIVVAPGANLCLEPGDVVLPDVDGVLCQQEIPAQTVGRAALLAHGHFFLNASPARPGAPDADLTIVNEYEFQGLPGPRPLVCVTLGGRGALLLENGKEVARASPPSIEAVDGTGAGDAFAACLVISLLQGRPRQDAPAAGLRRGSAGGLPLRGPDLVANRRGGRLPAVTTPIVLDCDPGQDDAIAILLALASPQVDVRAITTVAGNQTLDKTTRNALKMLELAGRTDIPVAAGAGAPLRRPLRTAAHVHGESGLDGPDLPDPQIRPVDATAVDLLAGTLEPGVILVATAPLTNVAHLLERRPDVCARVEAIVWMGGSIGVGNVTPAAEFNAFVDPEAAAAVFGAGIPITMIGLDVTHLALFQRSHFDRLRPASRAGRVVAELGDFFLPIYEQRYGLAGSPIHDALAVAQVVDPTLVTTRHVNVEIETASNFCDGRTIVDLRGVSGRPANAHVGVQVDSDRFLELLCSRIETLE
jgi:inosine-uridine nucleoside N-ribohydrolase/sugar/nucleoside kinase (ribokinase family)